MKKIVLFRRQRGRRERHFTGHSKRARLLFHPRAFFLIRLYRTFLLSASRLFRRFFLRFCRVRCRSRKFCLFRILLFREGNIILGRRRNKRRLRIYRLRE